MTIKLNCRWVMCCAIGALLSPAVMGQDGLPLRIENLIAPTGSSEINFSFRNSTGGSETIDSLNADIGYSYGWLQNTDIGLSLSGSYTDDRNADINRQSQCRSIFSNIGCSNEQETITRIGQLKAEISQSISPEAETPGVYGWLNIVLLDNKAREGENFERWRGEFNVGLSLYRTYDPIVLRTTFGYYRTPPQKTSRGLLDRGDTFTISPSILFAVNHFISISASTDIQITQSDTLDGFSDCLGCDYRRTRVYAGLGVSLSLKDRTTLYISSSLSASSEGGSSFGAHVRHRFKRDKLLTDSAANETKQSEAGEKVTRRWWSKHDRKIWDILAGAVAGERVRNAKR